MKNSKQKKMKNSKQKNKKIQNFKTRKIIKKSKNFDRKKQLKQFE